MQEKKFNYFYKITNLINGKYYYGMRSTNILPDNKYYGGGDLVRNAIKKYGKENFLKDIIIFFPTRGQLSEFESKMITMELVKDPMCYNCRTGGGNGYTRICSKETREKLSKALKGRIVSEETKNKMRGSNNHNFGKPPSVEQMRRLAEYNATRIISDETRKKLSIAGTGRTHSEETRKKLSVIHTGKTMSEEARKKLSIAHTGKKLSAEHVEKIVATNTGKVRSDEIKIKMSKAQIKNQGVRCEIDGKKFDSIIDAANYLNITRKSVWSRLKSKAKRFERYKRI